MEDSSRPAPLSVGSLMLRRRGIGTVAGSGTRGILGLARPSRLMWYRSEIGAKGLDDF
jgi:hypothetical protein